MDFARYLVEFEYILNSPSPAAPYDNPAYLEYAKLNWSRMHRWLKKGELRTETKAMLERIAKPLHWIVITEPWCGDAAHSVPFIQLMAQHNAAITVEYELRDSLPFTINEYLTNGSKSIPKLIIRDEEGNDLAVWGPRPVGCQQLYDRLKAEGADFEIQKVALQNWYNTDKGSAIQQELMLLLSDVTSSVQSL
ncbi:thioredoxin family protein [Parapedobacter koreensis]|uniref:Thioredoxin n=1 Tax=Parapedobacter koreensis TaxID=332977 RepID=A0A1H7RKA8_9SPHI|nr:thioredoxin family protein [Parapedobacter koreensis]SEL60686.1 Thioredoxin [Parapedobacter koreensis]